MTAGIIHSPAIATEANGTVANSAVERETQDTDDLLDSRFGELPTTRRLEFRPELDDQPVDVRCPKTVEPLGCDRGCLDV